MRSYVILEAENAELKRQNVELAAKVERLEEALKSIANAGYVPCYDYDYDKNMSFINGYAPPSWNILRDKARQALANLEGGG